MCMLHELISKRCFYDQGVKWVLDEMRAALIRAVRPAHLYVLILQVPTIVVLLVVAPFPPQNVIMKFSTRSVLIRSP